MIQAETENIYIIGATTCEIHAQGFAECPFKRGLGGGEQISVESLSVTANGTYTAPSGTAYSPVTVDVQEQPWQPLQDGYSNFWFELTDDTLSPWLNFSAKTESAVIDWGDGSGEVALDTLTPTHTYSKAGKYVVKVKGVTEITRQHTSDDEYFDVLKAVEFAAEMGVSTAAIFYKCIGLKYISMENTTITAIPNYFAAYAPVTDLTFPSTVTTIGTYASQNNYYLKSVRIPANVSSIGNSAFVNNMSCKIIHVQATVPPTLGTLVFSGAYPTFIIYVPVGTGDTYKSAAGWSAYSDHILEEGQTVTKAMQRKFAKEAKAIEDTGDMR